MAWFKRKKKGRMAEFKKHSRRTVRRGCEQCGSTDLYWAHDEGAESKDYCEECHSWGALVLVEPDLVTRHSDVCEVAPKKEEEPYRIPNPRPWDPIPEFKFRTEDFFKGEFPEVQWGYPDVKKTEDVQTQLEDSKKKENVAKDQKKKDTDVQAALELLVGALAPQKDADEIRSLIKEEFNNVVFPTRTVIQTPKGEIKELEGKTHNKVGDIIIDLQAGEHVMMVGPAGTGKSTIAEQAAEALGFPFYAISLSPQTPASQILGYQQAAGEYVRSLYREAYENGGVFHFDEVDNAHPSVLAVINASLANGQMAFPDRMVSRHKNFRCVASANTYGRGADRAYVGRQQIDAATLDRFTIETIEIDEALETDLCLATGLDNDRVQHVLGTVRKYRKNAMNKKMTVVLSPRATIGMCRLLQEGRTWDDALEARVRRGMSDADWSKLTG